MSERRPEAAGLDAVVGHERQRAFLSRALENGRITHAYLLSGPPRIGKTTLARALAGALLCLASGPRAGAPCGACVACRRLVAGTHPDLLLIERQTNEKGREAKNISVRQVDRLLHDVGLTPSVDSRRAYVIADAEDLSAEAMNSLLKTLEEPPPGVTLLLTASEPGRLLPTIVSRCQRIALAPVDATELRSALVARGADERRAEVLAHVAIGRVGWAFEALEDEALMLEREAAMDDLTRLPGASRLARLAYAEELAALGGRDPARLRERLGLWLGWWRDLALARAGCPELVVNADRRAVIEEQAARFELTRLRGFVDEIDRAHSRLAHNVNARMALDVLLLAVPRP